MPDRRRARGKRGVDRDALHEWLFERWCDKNGILLIGTGELAELIGMNLYAVSHLLREFRDSGRIRRVGTRYQVYDPQAWAWDHRRDLLEG